MSLLCPSSSYLGPLYPLYYMQWTKDLYAEKLCVFSKHLVTEMAQEVLPYQASVREDLYAGML